MALPLFACAVLAQEAQPSALAKVGVHSDRFATIAGGWWLERRCAFLEEADARAFETLVAQMNKAMR